MSNILKRSKKLSKIGIAYISHPQYRTVEQLYLNNTIKSIASVKKTLRDIKIKKDGKLYKTSIKKVEKIENLRPLDSFFKQINDSLNNENLIMNKIQQKTFKQKILQDKYVLKVEHTNKSTPSYHTVNMEYVNAIIDLTTNHHFEIDDGEISTSFKMNQTNYDGVSKFEFFTTNTDNVNFIDNKNGSFFNYLNTTKLDLTRYQIIRKEDDGETINKNQCLIHCFKLFGIDESVVNAVCLAMPSHYIPKSALEKISKIIKKQIVVHSYENKRTNKREQVYGDFKEKIDIAMFKSHYFLYDDSTIYNKYFIDNYEKLINIDNCYNIKRMSKGKYYEYGEQRCDSLYLVLS